MKKNMMKALLAVAALTVCFGVKAQEEYGFEKFDVEKAFTENGFQWFRKAEILAAGSKKKHNAMTIGWGGIGTLWGRTALTVYVAEKRYTKKFMDESQYFTVMTFGPKHANVLRYMGSKSGRNGDKAAALKLHTAYTANGTPYYTNSSHLPVGYTEVCRTLRPKRFPQRCAPAALSQQLRRLPHDVCRRSD